MTAELTNDISDFCGDAKLNRRSPLEATLLSFLCPGLGQMYCGHLVKGIIFYIALIIGSWASAFLFMVVDSNMSVAFFSLPVIGFLAIAADAYFRAKRDATDYKLKWYNRGWIYIAVVTSLFVTVNPMMDLVVGGNMVRALMVFSDSMSPTILKHDVLPINKLAYSAAPPKRGDIVLIQFKESENTNLTDVINNELVRRIVAIPGDTVEVKGNSVFVNDELLSEPYAIYHEHGNTDPFPRQTVPENSYFVLGDNRNYSIDSTILGFIGKERIGGKVSKVFWSWNFDTESIHWERTGLTVR